MKRLFVLLVTLISFGFSIHAQKSPSDNFSKKEVENFKGNKFGWEETNTKGAKAVIKDGCFVLSGKRPTFSPEPVMVVSSAKLPIAILDNFKITVKLQVVELTGHSAFQILLNSGNVVFAIAESGWAVVANNPNPTCSGQINTSKDANVSLSIQKEGTTLFFSYNNTLLCTVESQEIKSSDIILSLANIVTSAEIKINEVVVEQ